jgi:hypothetical protein
MAADAGGREVAAGSAGKPRRGRQRKGNDRGSRCHAGSSPEVQYTASGALGRLSMNAWNAVAISFAGAIPMLVQLLRECSPAKLQLNGWLLFNPGAAECKRRTGVPHRNEWREHCRDSYCYGASRGAQRRVQPSRRHTMILAWRRCSAPGLRAPLLGSHLPCCSCWSLALLAWRADQCSRNKARAASTILACTPVGPRVHQLG